MVLHLKNHTQISINSGQAGPGLLYTAIWVEETEPELYAAGQNGGWQRLTANIM